MKTVVKVCGMTRPEQVKALDALGVDLLGFIFAAKSPRCVSPELVARMPGTRAKKVGVFVEHSVEDVLRIMNQARLDMAQLHGGQNQDFCRAVGPARVIRAFWPARHDSLAALEEEIASFTGCCAFALLDAGTSGGGHGKTLDFAALAALDVPMPWLLAGGLSPDNISEAVFLARPCGVDLNSGVETSPGIKDIVKIKLALETINPT